jgi:hypothetical protein
MFVSFILDFAMCIDPFSFLVSCHSPSNSSADGFVANAPYSFRAPSRLPGYKKPAGFDPSTEDSSTRLCIFSGGLPRDAAGPGGLGRMRDA